MKKIYETPVVEVDKFTLSTDILESVVGGGEEWVEEDGTSEDLGIFTIRGYGVTGFGWE